MYSETVIKHFADPHNVGITVNADNHARTKSSVYDGLVDMYIKDKDGLFEASIRVLGCAVATTSRFMTTVLVTGKSLQEAEGLDEEMIVTTLEELYEGKSKYSVLATEVLAGYRRK